MPPMKLVLLILTSVFARPGFLSLLPEIKAGAEAAEAAKTIVHISHVEHAASTAQEYET